MYNHALLDLLTEQAKKPYLVMCERHPQHEVTHYCTLHEELCCEDCKGRHLRHHEKYLSPLSNGDIERGLAKLGSELSIV